MVVKNRVWAYSEMKLGDGLYNEAYKTATVYMY